MKKQANSWLEAALSDIQIIEEVIELEHLTHMVAFHSQQAIEKVLKAILEEYDKKVPKTHELVNLSENAREVIEFEIDYDITEQLNELYLDARYPTDIGLLPNGKPSVETSKTFYRYARNLYETIKAALS